MYLGSRYYMGSGVAGGKGPLVAMISAVRELLCEDLLRVNVLFLIDGKPNFIFIGYKQHFMIIRYMLHIKRKK